MRFRLEVHCTIITVCCFLDFLLQSLIASSQIFLKRVKYLWIYAMKFLCRLQVFPAYIWSRIFFSKAKFDVKPCSYFWENHKRACVTSCSSLHTTNDPGNIGSLIPPGRRKKKYLIPTHVRRNSDKTKLFPSGRNFIICI